MKRISLLCVAFAIGLVLPCGAWHEDRPKNFKFEPEQSESVVEELQSKQKVVGEIGNVPDIGERPDANDLEESGDESDLTTAANRKVRSPYAAADLRNVEKRARRAREKSLTLPIAGVVFAVLGFGTVMAVRQYAARTAPPMPKVKRDDL